MSDIDQDDLESFSAAMEDVKPLRQDTIRPERPPIKRVERLRPSATKRAQTEQPPLSDTYQARLPDDGPVALVQDGESRQLLKRLKGRFFDPEAELDLHGLNRESAKRELIALVHYARRHHLEQLLITTGRGSGVLRAALPHWLIQMPEVRALHQAPRHLGGRNALAVLVQLNTRSEFSG